MLKIVHGDEQAARIGTDMSTGKQGNSSLQIGETALINCQTDEVVSQFVEIIRGKSDVKKALIDCVDPAARIPRKTMRTGLKEFERGGLQGKGKGKGQGHGQGQSWMPPLASPTPWLDHSQGADQIDAPFK